jgi:ABC-type multidrug transport system ATPase subunit
MPGAPGTAAKRFEAGEAAGHASPWVECREVSHYFAPGRGLAPVSFSCAGPGLTAITGPNGSGKSTLLRVLAGLLRPAAGATQMREGGTSYTGAARRHVTGWCSPELQFYVELSVRENLAFAAESLGLAPSAAEAAAREIGLEARLDDRAGALSSGLRQRLRIAFALLGNPALLLLDEPGSHLDDEGRRTLAEVLRRRGRTARVLFATNDPGEWNLAAERIPLGPHGLGHPA